jgi:predicted phosphate transport protein (TIGR00153 family)
MLNFLFKKELQVESLIYDYLETLKQTQENFLKAFKACLQDPCGENLDFLIAQTHKFESKADDIREEIKLLMYGKALIPDARGDIMGLLESIDEIPRLFERVLYMIQTQRLYVPPELEPDISELVRISLECCDLVVEQVTALLQKKEGIRSQMNIIDTNESHCDHIERRIIIKVFDSDIDPFVKLQVKELVVEIGNISDQADRVSRRINIISMKRRV